MTNFENLSTQFFKKISIRSARAPLRANRLRRARAKDKKKKNDAKIFDLKKYSKSLQQGSFYFKGKSHSTFWSTRGIICYSTSQFETKIPLKWIHQRIGPQTTALSFYFHCFKQLLTIAEDCLDLYKKKCPAKT